MSNSLQDDNNFNENEDEFIVKNQSQRRISIIIPCINII